MEKTTRHVLDGMIAENERIIRVVKKAMANPDTSELSPKVALALLLISLEGDLRTLKKLEED